MYFDNQPASEEQMSLFRTIKVDQAIGMVTEAELGMELCLDANGNWAGFTESFSEPFVRIRIEVKIGEGNFTPLIDGPVIAQKLEMAAAPCESTLTLFVHDDSFTLNRDETVAVFNEMSASDIAQQLFSNAGMESQVDSVSEAGGTMERAIVQRGTAMQLLRDLARRHGMFVYVKPGTTPGVSIGVFKRPALDADDLPRLILVGQERNLNKLNVDFDGLRPFQAVASQIDVANQEVLRAEAQETSQESLGDTTTHDLVEPGTVFLARTRETDADLDAAVTAAVDYASWAYSAKGEVHASTYLEVMQPYVTVRVAGAGPMSGRYLISQVTHVIDNGNYTQQFTLRRNARSNVSGGNGGQIAGVF